MAKRSSTAVLATDALSKPEYLYENAALSEFFLFRILVATKEKQKKSTEVVGFFLLFFSCNQIWSASKSVGQPKSYPNIRLPHTF